MTTTCSGHLSQGNSPVDLFSGVGGFTLGAVFAGMDVLGCVEVDSDLSGSHCTNFPSIKLIKKDLFDMSPSELLRTVGIDSTDIDGLIGGPPCQGFSIIGKRDIEDARNDLLKIYFDYVEELDPDFFVLENVPGLIMGEYERLLSGQTSRVADVYTIIGPFRSNASSWGVPTDRERIFIVGSKKGRLSLSEEDFLEPKDDTKIVVRDAISDLERPDCGIEDQQGDYWGTYKANGTNTLPHFAQLARNGPPDHLSTPEIRCLMENSLISGFKPTNHSSQVIERFQGTEPGKRDSISKFPRLSWSELSPTLRAGTGKDKGRFQAVRPIHPNGERVLTVREAARIQSFPDWFQFHHTIWHSWRMIGNSVPPLMAKGILQSIQDRWKREE